MSTRLLIFDTHPVQYRVPVWQEMERLQPGCIHVVYASDCSVRGYSDMEFGQQVVWDEPLLQGYDFTILNCEQGTPFSSWRSLTGSGVAALIKRYKPDAILLVGMLYQYDLAAYLKALSMGIPVWLRCDNQDHAFPRSAVKSFFRRLVYRTAYLGISRFFIVGQLNREHYLKIGVAPANLRVAHHCTIDRFIQMPEVMKAGMRTKKRKEAGIAEDKIVLGFSGKLIQKKNPDILFKMLPFLPSHLRSKLVIYFMGSGELEPALQELARIALAQWGVQTVFAGFVNQSQLAGHYLAMDLLVLPSRRMGETWGLVANEALQAGCRVVVSDAVGCSADFKNWEGFAVFTDGDEKALGAVVAQLAFKQRDFNWAQPLLRDYSIQSVAQSLLSELNDYKLAHKPKLVID